MALDAAAVAELAEFVAEVAAFVSDVAAFVAEVAAAVAEEAALVSLVAAFVADVDAADADVDAAVAEVAALVALVEAALACVDAVVADEAAAVAELAALVSDVPAFVSDVAALVADVAAFVSDVPAFVSEVAALVADVAAALALDAAAVALDAAAVALAAAAVALVDAAAASTNNAHFALSVFVLIGVDPLDVCAVIQMYTLLLLASLTISRTEKAVLAAQSPCQTPSSCVTAKSPDPSKLNTLFARSAAEIVNSEPVSVFVRDALIARPNSSSCFCVIKTILSSASSSDCAGNGSLGTRSSPCVKGCSRKITTVCVEVGAVTNYTSPPLALPTFVTV